MKKRFEIVGVLNNNYQLIKDNLNNRYAVFIKCDKFSQQTSKWYVKFGWAYKALIKTLNLNKIKL